MSLCLDQMIELPMVQLASLTNCGLIELSIMLLIKKYVSIEYINLFFVFFLNVLYAWPFNNG